jgi:hypothetical protein
MKIENQKEFEKLFDIVKTDMPLEDEKKNQLKDPDQEIIDLYSETDSF